MEKKGKGREGKGREGKKEARIGGGDVMGKRENEEKVTGDGRKGEGLAGTPLEHHYHAFGGSVAAKRTSPKIYCRKGRENTGGGGGGSGGSGNSSGGIERLVPLLILSTTLTSPEVQENKIR
ncbi:hypothetical protein E2C01_085654 [Portunus trituberculatus]|uniref:Uncharacterized protein n=1 Tax=Portunus trituberculatus TaxID=210409 RepID=A0A5B7JB96_PORTR|nr:hypothetical protein [Portunus trituberculatus]